MSIFFFVGPFMTSEYTMIELDEFLRDDPGFLDSREPGTTWWFPYLGTQNHLVVTELGNTWLLRCFYARELLMRLHHYFTIKAVDTLSAYLPVKQ